MIELLPLPEPASRQFQDNKGAWYNFLNTKHYWDTKEAGYAIRDLYTADQLTAHAARVRAEAMERKPTCDVGHAHFTPFYLLSNCRRILAREHARKPNWAIAMELFAVGSTTAKRICQESNIDPDATVVRLIDLGSEGAK